METVMNFEIENVVQFANEAHKGQYRKGSGLPYIVHPIGVLQMIGADWCISDFDLWKATLCHDVLEDTAVTYEELRKVIGDFSASIVRELTFEVDPDNPLLNHEQKAQYMKTFNDKSVSALVIKCADRFCNVCDFMATCSDYARKYWKKADDLMDTMFSRGDEIVDAFGVDAFANMKYTRTLLTRQLS